MRLNMVLDTAKRRDAGEAVNTLASAASSLP